MYANFDGDFRRRPQQNLSGASSKLSRQEIIQKAQQERQKRETQRQQLRASLCIQSFYRSYLVRKWFKEEQRKIYNDLQKNYVAGTSLEPLITRILLFYDKSEDFDRLVWLCQNILKQKQELLQLILKNTSWRYRIQSLLNLSIKSLLLTKNNAILLRILDVFLSEQLCTNMEYSSIVAMFYTSLAKKDFFENMRQLLEQSTKIESNPTLFIELSNFVIRPVTLIRNFQNLETVSHYSELIFLSLCRSILSREFTETIKHIFIENMIKVQFPYKEFYYFLINYQSKIDLSVYLFYSVLKLVPNFANESHITINYYLQAISLLSENIRKNSKFEKLNYLNNFYTHDYDDDDDDMDVYEKISETDAPSMLMECVEMCNEESFVNNILICLSNHTIHEDIMNNIMNSLAQICFNLLTREENAVQKYKFLYMLAFKPTFLRSLWNAPDNKELVDGLQKGAHVLDIRYVPSACRLSTFFELFNLLLTTLHDDEFWSTDLAGERQSGVSSMPFSANELVNMCETLKQLVDGLIELTASTPRHSTMTLQTSSAYSNNENLMKFWYVLYKSAVKIITNLHQKDSRIQFCSENLWTKKNMFNFPTDFNRIEQVARVFAEIDVENKPPLTICETRWIQVLRDLPFLLPFTSRVLLFRALVNRLHRQHQDPDRTPFLLGPSVNISVRRSHIYEDAYLKLQDSDLRQKLRVQFVNAVGLEEAGIDGGGILREFLSELLTTCFDPNRGYFKLNRSNLLYPNPNVHKVEVDFSRHYYFIGKMLGKALYENIQVELPLAEFFLTKLVSKKFDVDFHYLASLDQVMYKNMLFLKNYQGNIQDLGLDFTIVNEELGETRVDELKPNGSNIPVTSTNRIEYIHLLADYKMNKQIRQQCLAFKEGLHSVIDLEYLQIFSNKELQLIISGADYDVDINDLKEHTNYSGDRTAEHPVIKIFWQIVESFDSLQKRQLLKFVTSCSRPPLLGFKELQPAFCIQLSDGTDRLPTASTCMNLLKIPAIPDPDVLRDRLLYAISQGAGFELS